MKEKLKEKKKETFVLSPCIDSEWVTLNVGGTIFSTTRSTLCKDPESMLSKMFGDSQWSSFTDRSGAFLIDRTPEYFGPLLHFLRTGSILIPLNVDKHALLEEARFFNITGAIEYLERELEKSKPKTDLTREEFIRLLVFSSAHDRLRCQGLNLEGIDLSYLDLSMINFKLCNLKNANLRGANCEYVNFECADLSGANLQGCNMMGANFSRAKLENADARKCNFEDSATGKGANFGGANLNSTVFEDSNLSKANLRVASLRSSNLRNCNLRNAVLAGADLRDSNMSGCNMQNTNLRGANLLGANFDSSTPIHMFNLSNANIF